MSLEDEKTEQPAVKVEIWEGEDYVVTVGGKPCGQTVDKREGEKIAGWLRTALAEIRGIK